MEQITLDLIPKGSLPVLHASQYDDGRQWQVNLKENGEDYTLTNETIVLGVRKGDGCAVTCAVAIESGKKYVILTSTEQMCAVAGQNLAELQITKDNTKIGTLNFILQVERDPLAAGISSGTEIHDLQHQVDECVHTAFETIGASGLPYDNTESGLTADNVQQAIDEVNEKASSLPSYVYTKEETDALIADKADKATLEADYYDKAETDALLDDKADASAFGDYYTKSETNTKLSGKADKGSVYTTAQVNTLLGDKADKSDLDNYYTKSQANSLLNDKANKANVYDKNYINDVLGQIDNAFTDVNTALGQKANSSDVYSKTYIDTALSAKANANAVYTKAETDAKVAGLIDDETTASNKTWSSNKISTELVSLLPVDEESGAVANFETEFALPLIEINSSILPTEVGSGTKAPDNEYELSGFDSTTIKRTGKNLYVYDESKVFVGKTTAQAQRAYYDLGFSNCTLSFSGSYKSGATPNKRRINIGKLVNGQLSAVSSYIVDGAVTSYTLTYGANERAVLILTLNDTDALKTELQLLDLQVELGSNVTAFEQYIASQTTIPLGRTVWGGSLSLVRKAEGGYSVKLRVSNYGFTVTGDEEENWTISNAGTANFYYVFNLPTGSSSAVANTVSANIFEKVNISNTNTAEGCYNTASDLRVRYGTEMTVANWKTWLSEHNLKVIYKLATPVEYDLADVADIVALKGINNVWNDTNANVSVNYKIGIQAYIDKKIAEVQALVL